MTLVLIEVLHVFDSWALGRFQFTHILLQKITCTAHDMHRARVVEINGLHRLHSRTAASRLELESHSSLLQPQ